MPPSLPPPFAPLTSVFSFSLQSCDDVNAIATRTAAEIAGYALDLMGNESVAFVAVVQWKSVGLNLTLPANVSLSLSEIKASAFAVACSGILDMDCSVQITELPPQDERCEQRQHSLGRRAS